VRRVRLQIDEEDVVVAAGCLVSSSSLATTIWRKTEKLHLKSAVRERGRLLVLRRLLDVPRDPFLPSSAGSVSPLLRLLL
jgi:hypothetical protein